MKADVIRLHEDQDTSERKYPKEVNYLQITPALSESVKTFLFGSAGLPRMLFLSIYTSRIKLETLACPSPRASICCPNFNGSCSDAVSASYHSGQKDHNVRPSPTRAVV